MTIDELRGYGMRRVTLRADYGDFDGSIVQELLSADSVMILFARGGDREDQIVIPVDGIRDVVER